MFEAAQSLVINYSLPFLSACLVGLCGIFPLLIIPTEVTEHLQSKAGSKKLNRLLSFAIGSMLGDVFLHLLPEAYQSSLEAASRNSSDSSSNNSSHSHILTQTIGIWTIVGTLTFLAIEKLLVLRSDNNDGDNGSDSGAVCSSDNNATTVVQAEGYLNLLANFIDNLTHGLAVGGSYIAGVKVGLITTFCILVHEIPHEISDFAILLRAGFHKWRAAKAQLITGSGSVLGALAAYSVTGAAAASSSAAIVLPFTSGGFLYLALASLAPQIIAEADFRESALQTGFLLCGFLSLYFVSLYL